MNNEPGLLCGDEGFKREGGRQRRGCEGEGGGGQVVLNERRQRGVYLLERRTGNTFESELDF